ncbi:MAG: hypothetical protein M3512_11375 [Bacteroidota bacterium]|nr:hypothetical protein [Bacteroidota bacterium]
MIYRLIIFTCTFLIFVFACNPADNKLGIATDYLPQGKHLREGVVNKYYSHTHSGSTSSPYSIFFYESYQLVEPNKLLINKFNAGFELERSRTFVVNDNKMVLLEEKNIHLSDTINTEILEPYFLNWNGHGEGAFERIISYNKYHKLLHKEQQKHVRDTVVLNRKAKIFEKDYRMQNLATGDTIINEHPSKVIYVEKFGLFSIFDKNQESEFNLELVEQMSLNTFQELAKHERKRVAYIDPKETLDHDENFALCGLQLNVADYYNSSPHVQYSKGKRVMVNLINSKIIKQKLNDESGYLTFRFIVNCKGEPGWFKIEQSDLNFNEKKFNQETIDHLYEIVYDLKTWSPSVLDETPRDVYIYLTFKIKNGELLDILP